ncbi:KEOPS complex component [Halobiforma lacisalsi AJ5]|uniref:KEOPS complex Cgi121-like subunit n=1 Tax=Natronobacterium lacisalsi AJ5 TaxID=358396 RepID=M0LMI1_NATLA|nr:KEOPS complex subunit Cgi121 [Halobiforma lacisalsi]APW97050.1 KEOPS complex component [Halobiforma lacisalsi AJ5]EMA34767.1 KEOPS complex Cgi121-like subunit [Halobiforma lacisalsi AJ5]
MQLLECSLTIDDLDAFVAAIGEIGDRHGVTIQAFDARYVADPRHLERAVAFADRAIERGENVARDRAVEILLYAAGRRQIDRALEMGVDEGENRAVVLVDSREGDRRAERDALAALRKLDAVAGEEPALASLDEKRLCEFFEITDAEREATDASLGDLVRERVALLEVEK